VFIPQAVNTV